ncbi:hypothetical protein LINGRAHAP2_LOCUS24831 [Linum grandiflorum]
MEEKEIRDFILNGIKFGYHHFECAAVRYIRKQKLYYNKRNHKTNGNINIQIRI